MEEKAFCKTSWMHAFDPAWNPAEILFNEDAMGGIERVRAEREKKWGLTGECTHTVILSNHDHDLARSNAHIPHTDIQ